MTPSATYHFPAGFLWGAATAAHQVEGSNTTNNWSDWENQPGRIINGDKAGLAADWWGGRWKEDFDRAAATGQNAHRMSIEWSRIQPTPEHWSEDVIDYYRQMVRGLVERGLTPMVTLHHFSEPRWLAEKGGWENPDTPGLFAAFTRKVVEALKEYVTYWVPINEPNTYVTGAYLEGSFPPGKKDTAAAFNVSANLLRGHAAAYQIIHSLQKEARVGSCINYRSFQPKRPWLPLDSFITNFLAANYNDSFIRTLVKGRFSYLGKRQRIPEAAKTQDFVGVNYYSRDLVAFKFSYADFFSQRTFPPGAPLSQTGFIAHVPAGIYEAIDWARRFDLPILITENGVEDSEDRLRPRYLVEHLHQVWRTVNYNWPVKGYFHWTLVDNFEWERGWSQRFGLWGLDLATQKRIRRPSVDLYAAICKENGIASSAVEKYAPESLQVLFPE